MKMTDQIRTQEEELLSKINAQNEETKNALLDEFKQKMQGGSALSDSDKQTLFQDFADRIDRMSQMLAGE